MSSINSSRIFITGAGGQLGSALRKRYPDARYADVKELDLTDSSSVEEYDWSGVEIIMNAAAYTNVDGAETAEGRTAAWAVNATAVGNLVVVARKNNITLVHVSTDYVFDGSQDQHSETEQFSPLSVYGDSKAAGDLLVGSLDKHYIIRTSWVIGEGNNFVRTMASLAAKDISPTVVHDQIGRLTFTSELVRVIDHLTTSNAPYGTYNVTNEGDSVSWADITREIYSQLERTDLTVTNTTTAEYYEGKQYIAPRPLKSTMKLDKIKSTGFIPRNWIEDLKLYIEKGD
jgi:dTDP-4-dehydrorhamnose reductase